MSSRRIQYECEEVLIAAEPMMARTVTRRVRPRNKTQSSCLGCALVFGEGSGESRGGGEELSQNMQTRERQG